MAWRKAWAHTWEQVRHCSEGCRRHRPGAVDRAMEEVLLAALGTPRWGALVDPVAVVEAGSGPRPPGGVETARVLAAARRLWVQGQVDVVVGGVAVTDPSGAGVGLRLRRRHGPAR